MPSRTRLDRLSGLHEAADVAYATCCALEALGLTPMGRRGAWRKAALQLAAFFGVEPIELFPSVLQDIQQTTVERRFDENEIVGLPGFGASELPERPDDALERAELREGVRRSLADLTPRQADVLRRRFGFDGGEPQACAEVGDGYQLTGERIRQIEATALRKLRLSAALWPFVV